MRKLGKRPKPNNESRSQGSGASPPCLQSDTGHLTSLSLAFPCPLTWFPFRRVTVRDQARQLSVHLHRDATAPLCEEEVTDEDEDILNTWKLRGPPRRLMLVALLTLRSSSKTMQRRRSAAHDVLPRCEFTLLPCRPYLP
jgi:hypothetical protein